MRLKDYQTDTLATFAAFLGELKRQKARADTIEVQSRQRGAEPPPDAVDVPAMAWREFVATHTVPMVAGKAPDWVGRADARGRSIPHVCLKIPTGGGKTLIGAAAIERMRPQNGLLLWVMPSQAIFRQTWQLLARRMSPYRQTLERACGGRVKLIRKDEPIARLDVEHYLCIMPIMLQASSGKNRRDFLRIFRDSGRYPQFFPEPDDPIGNAAFVAAHPDLDVHDRTDRTDGTGGGAIKHSLYNVLKVVRPIIVLDEAHNAYSHERRRDLCRFDPRFILELSATPTAGVSNILVDICGLALKNEEMIKLPLNIHTIANADWKYTLARATEQRDALEAQARRLQGEAGRYIRPIMLIRAERVGSDQRDGRHIHAADVRACLQTELNVPADHIREKTAHNDEIGRDDLLSPYSPVRYIITKDALREGWDCPFAYLLVLLDRTRTNRAITQMTGRILRQPNAQRTGCAPLDECYLYCLDHDVGEAAAYVKKGLETEGLGDLGEFINGEFINGEFINGEFINGGNGDNGGKEGAVVQDSITIGRRTTVRDTRISLPQVLDRVSNGACRPLDYARDVLAQLNWPQIAATDWGIASLGQPDEITETIDSVDVGLARSDGHEALPTDTQPTDTQPTLEFFARRLHDVSPNAWISARAAQGMLDALITAGHSAADILAHRVYLSETLKRAFAARVDAAAERIVGRSAEMN